jgi:transposase InsO family protein
MHRLGAEQKHRPQLAMNALAKALENRWPEANQGLVHHSDQGIQYASKYYVDCLKEHKHPG